MRHLIVVYLPYFLSCITLATMYLAGNKTRSAWVLGLIGQAFWLAWVIASNSWGLLPLTFALVFVYARNLRKWNV